MLRAIAGAHTVTLAVRTAERRTDDESVDVTAAE
jgi:hypothetical protein